MLSRSVWAALWLALGAVGMAEGSEITVTGAWARATAPGQQVAGIYFDILSRANARLVGLQSPAADRGELHEMRMDDGIMRMRRLDAIALPAGEKIQLKPAGLHAMLFGLKQPLRAGDNLPITLAIVDAKGVQLSIRAEVQVRNLDGTDPHQRH
jgi:copper(I)-binding protein